LSAADAWAGRWQTLSAMLLLCRARLLIALVPLGHWRDSLGLEGGISDPGGQIAARRLAAQVARAATRLPFRTRCLPRAMALSTMLRRAGIAHTLVFAVRPRAWTGPQERLHAWVEREGERLVGDLPGPWIEALHLGAAIFRPDPEGSASTHR